MTHLHQSSSSSCTLLVVILLTVLVGSIRPKRDFEIRELESFDPTLVHFLHTRAKSPQAHDGKQSNASLLLHQQLTTTQA